MSTAHQIPGNASASSTTKKKGRFAATGHTLRTAAQVFYYQLERTRLFTQAAALTYKTLFSLLPIFVLSVLILSAISLGDGNKSLDVTVRQSLFEEMGLNQLYLTDNNGNTLTDPSVKPVTFSSWVEPFIDKARKSVKAPTTGIVAFGVLLYSAISLMIVIESTFNLIYGSARPRTLIRRIMLYWCVLTLGPIGVGASIVLGRLALHTAHSYSALGWILPVVNALSGFAVSWLLALLMYRVIPDTQVKWRPAIVGSFVAAVAWEIGKWGFGLYVEHAVRSSVYGSLALLPLFMLWIYITWSVVLLGLQVSYVQQHWKMLRHSLAFQRGAGPTAGLSDVRWMLPLAALLCQRFKAGKPLDSYEAAESLLLPPQVTRSLFVALEKAGIVHHVSTRAFTLARPPDSVTAFDLLSAAATIFQTPAGPVGPPQSAARDLIALETQWAKNTTLQSLATNC